MHPAPGVRDVTIAGNHHFYYPAGQRTFTFSDQPGADAPPLQVSTGQAGGTASVKLLVRGTVTFRLNTDCTPYREYKNTGQGKVLVRTWPGGLFQRFHDVIGRQDRAFATDGGQPQPAGWDQVMRIYVGGPISKAANDEGLHFTWQQLYADPAANAAWQQAVIKDLPSLVDQQAGAPQFLIDNVQLLQPTLPAGLEAELENNQAATLRHTTADIDKNTAAGFPGGVQAYLDYLRQLAVNDAIKNGNVRVIPIPQGSPVIVGAQ